MLKYCPDPKGFKTGDIPILIDFLPDAGIDDEVPFGEVNGAKGQKLILSPEQAKAIRRRQFILRSRTATENGGYGGLWESRKEKVF